MSEKEAVLAAGHKGVFTIEHFNGYAAVLIALRKARTKDVRAAIRDAHRAIAAASGRRRRSLPSD